MRRMSSQRDDNIKELNHRMATQHDNLSTAQDEVDDANDKRENTKAKKANRRFRPWFTACSREEKLKLHYTRLYLCYNFVLQSSTTKHLPPYRLS